MSTTGDEQSESVTDRHTDGRTDSRSRASSRYTRSQRSKQSVDPDRANRGSGPAETDLHPSCPWVGLTHGLGWVGLGWVTQNGPTDNCDLHTVKLACQRFRTIRTHPTHLVHRPIGAVGIKDTVIAVRWRRCSLYAYQANGHNSRHY